MPLEISALTDSDRDILTALWQLYSHDLSEFRDTLPDGTGRFPDRRLAAYFDDPDRGGYVARRDGVIIGFALLIGLADPPVRMGDFFVARGVRRGAVGGTIARAVIGGHPGPWRIAFQEENPGAARFWRGLVDGVAAAGWHEERRPVPGKPDVPDDHWLIFDTRS